jgi:glycosyltransferase involved in cell wall biosynthesis
MKIVIVNKFLELTGGADRHCAVLGRALRARGHEVRFFASSSDPAGQADGVFVNATVAHASREELPLRARAEAAAKAFWNPEAAQAMDRLLAEFRPDVVHVHKLHPQLSSSPLVVASRRGVSIVQTLHDFELISASPIDARGGRWDADETRFSYKLLNSTALPFRRRLHRARVNAFVAISRFQARTYERHGIQATVIPSFVDVRDGGAPPPSFEQRRGIVFLGRLRPEKGVMDVVELARMLPRMPVTILGGGVLENDVQRAAAELPNLVAPGFVGDEAITREVERARVVVVPSRCQEGGNLACLEAMAHGTPVVAYANGGLAENVVDTGGGRIVPVDVKALAEVATEVHEDREAWEQLAGRGHAAVRRRHSPEVYAEDLERVYEGVL